MAESKKPDQTATIEELQAQIEALQKALEDAREAAPEEAESILADAEAVREPIVLMRERFGRARRMRGLVNLDGTRRCWNVFMPRGAAVGQRAERVDSGSGQFVPQQLH